MRFTLDKRKRKQAYAARAAAAMEAWLVERDEAPSTGAEALLAAAEG